MYLLDTNVVSEIFFKRKVNTDPLVRAWFEQALADDTNEIYISIVTLIELYNGGLEAVARHGRQEFAERIFVKCAETELYFSGRIVPLSTAVVAQWRALVFHIPEFYDKNCLFRQDCKDLFIGATSNAHDLTLVTRNLKDFQKMKGLKHPPYNPF